MTTLGPQLIGCVGPVNNRVIVWFFSNDRGNPLAGLRCQTTARLHRMGAFETAHQTMARTYALNRAGAWRIAAAAPMHGI